MAKEKKLFSVQAELNDRDFEDIFRVYMRYERGNEKKIGLLVSIALFLACILLTFVLSRLTLLFYGIGCAVIGLSYYLVPVNRKFLATNKLQFGEKREISFYPHQVTTMELFDDDNDDEYENSETAFSTMMLRVYENDRGFIFAEGKIVNQFLYLPKRCLSEEEIEEVRAFAQEKCSGGYHEADTMISEEDTETRAAKTDAVCDKYYGMENLRLCDDEGNRIHTEDEDAEPEKNAKAHTERIEEPEMDIDAEWEKIISEDEDEE